jgi:hypothetical protein
VHDGSNSGSGRSSDADPDFPAENMKSERICENLQIFSFTIIQQEHYL